MNSIYKMDFRMIYPRIYNNLVHNDIIKYEHGVISVQKCDSDDYIFQPTVYKNGEWEVNLYDVGAYYLYYTKPSIMRENLKRNKDTIVCEPFNEYLSIITNISSRGGASSLTPFDVYSQLERAYSLSMNTDLTLESFNRVLDILTVSLRQFSSIFEKDPVALSSFTKINLAMDYLYLDENDNDILKPYYTKIEHIVIPFIDPDDEVYIVYSTLLSHIGDRLNRFKRLLLTKSWEQIHGVYIDILTYYGYIYVLLS